MRKTYIPLTFCSHYATQKFRREESLSRDMLHLRIPTFVNYDLYDIGKKHILAHSFTRRCKLRKRMHDVLY